MVEWLHRGKGNISINKENAKRIEDGKVVEELPFITCNGKMVRLFTPLSPDKCKVCESALNANEQYLRYLISSYGILEIPVTYWVCSNKSCRKHHHDEIAGVSDGANYTDEYLDIQKYTRYNGKCSLHNNRTVGEIYTSHGQGDGRAACPATLWKYEQKMGVVALQKLRETEINFDGTIHCDGYWVKDGWKKFIEERLGRKLTEKQWKKLRYKVIYIAATSDKVVLDFEITDIQPSYILLIPLFARVKKRLGENNIKKVVSDEDDAIIGAVKSVIPESSHSFCVFHQLKNLTSIYQDEFKNLENLPAEEDEFYRLSQDLITAKDVITSTHLLQNLRAKGNTSTLSCATRRALQYIEKVYARNRKVLEMGFTPDTNNVSEQIFSLLYDFAEQSRSFKTNDGLSNWSANMFYTLNKRPFNTGPHRGVSPLEIGKCRPPPAT